jgi:hypothetical protein
MIFDEETVIKLLVRYTGRGHELSQTELEIVLFALYQESLAHRGMALQAEYRRRSA